MGAKLSSCAEKQAFQDVLLAVTKFEKALRDQRVEIPIHECNGQGLPDCNTCISDYAEYIDLMYQLMAIQELTIDTLIANFR